MIPLTPDELDSIVAPIHRNHRALRDKVRQRAARALAARDRRITELEMLAAAPQPVRPACSHSPSMWCRKCIGGKR